MNIRRLVIPIIMFLCIINYSHGQTKYLSLKNALELAQENNSTHKSKKWEEKISEANYRQTDAIFMPNIHLNYTGFGTDNPLNAFGFKLQQASIAQEDFNPVLLNSPGFTNNFSSSIEIKQPILNLNMIFERKAAKSQKEMAELSSLRTAQYIDFEVRRAYYMLQFSYKVKDILQHSLTNVSHIHETVTRFYEEGLLHKSDVLNAQIQVHTIENELAKSKTSIINTSNGLSILIGDQSSEIYDTEPLVILDYLYVDNILPQTRPDILAMGKAIESVESMVKSSKMNFLPTLNAFGVYQFNDKKAFGFNNSSYLFGVSFGWTIFNGTQSHHKLSSAKFQKNKLSEDIHLYVSQNQLEIDKSKRELEDIIKEIQKINVSIQHAEESLRITQNRFNEGLVSTNDLLIVNTQLHQQEILLAQSILSHNITLSYLLFLTQK